MADVLAEIEALKAQADTELAACTSNDALEQFRIKWLGGNGVVKAKMSLIGQAPKEQKKVVGQQLNSLKEHVSTGFEGKKESLLDTAGEPGIDITEPGIRPQIGNRHILMKVIDELTELFGRMGFSVAGGPEVEDEFHNFVALNIPESHPARDPLDNFYLEEKAGSDKETGKQGDKETAGSLKLLRTQTSTVQIRVMETQKPPIRV